MTLETRYLRKAPKSDIRFSVCSLVRDPARYALLLSSFAEYGFTAANSEFLAADNRDGNQFDGYSWIAGLFPECRGDYVIFCHEDIVLIDHGFDELLEKLEELETQDPRWLLAGVAGGEYRSLDNTKRNQHLRITDKYGSDRTHGKVPGRVETLDECFIVMKREKPVFNSYDLSGFHFYGPDICMMADLMGGTCYAIDFHLRHDGEATRGPSFRQSRRQFVEKYSKIFPGRTIHCTTGIVPLGGGWSDRQ